MPIQRFGSTLVSKGQFDALHAICCKHAYPRREPRHRDVPQPVSRRLAAATLYDCDFNQMLGLPLQLNGPAARAPARLLRHDLDGSPIRVADHCYGCTAGQGISCGGALAWRPDHAGVHDATPEYRGAGAERIDGIVACLRALAALRARGAEVIVADGGSTDATAEWARPLADQVLRPRAAAHAR